MVQNNSSSLLLLLLFLFYLLIYLFRPFQLMVFAAGASFHALCHKVSAGAVKCREALFQGRAQR